MLSDAISKLGFNFFHCPCDLWGGNLIFMRGTPVSGYASGKIIACLHPLFLYSVTVDFHPIGFCRWKVLVCSANHVCLPAYHESWQLKPSAEYSCG